MRGSLVFSQETLLVIVRPQDIAQNELKQPERGRWVGPDRVIFNFAIHEHSPMQKYIQVRQSYTIIYKICVRPSVSSSVR